MVGVLCVVRGPETEYTHTSSHTHTHTHTHVHTDTHTHTHICAHTRTLANTHTRGMSLITAAATSRWFGYSSRNTSPASFLLSSFYLLPSFFLPSTCFLLPSVCFLPSSFLLLPFFPCYLFSASFLALPTNPLFPVFIRLL